MLAIKGWRTLAFNGAIAAAAGLLTWASSVDWTQHVSPTGAIVVMAVINMGLRWVTTTPVGQSD